MSNIHNNGENDKSLNDELDKLGRAYGHLDQEEPPELLDQAILNSAHRSVETKSHWTQFGWLHGLTTAAVFVLAFSLILHQRESAPVFEDGISIEEPMRLQVDKAAKKQSLDLKTAPRKEMKPKDDLRQDANQDAPITSVPEGKAMAGQSRGREIESRLSGYTQEVMKDKAGSDDQDMEIAEVMLEELAADEADFRTHAPVPAEADRQLAPAAVAAPMIGASEPEARKKELSKTQAEQALIRIIELKQSGDPDWKIELESFMESYPEYPLPQELKDP